MSTLPIGTRVTFDDYGTTLTGTVFRDNGTGIVWLTLANGRKRWMHKVSLTIIPLEG